MSSGFEPVLAIKYKKENACGRSVDELYGNVSEIIFRDAFEVSYLLQKYPADFEVEKKGSDQSVGVLHEKCQYSCFVQNI